jgi:hypothetical protein
MIKIDFDIYVNIIYRRLISTFSVVNISFCSICARHRVVAKLFIRNKK